MNTNPFKPAWWLRNRHLQTIWPTLFRRRIKNLPLWRERIELPDGDFIDLDWTGHPKAPLVLILHGLEGSIFSPYARGMLQALHHHGWCGVFMHFRGCSGEDNRLLRAYHAGDTEDIAYILKILQQRSSGLPMAAIGFSLGGNILLKWLGQTQEKNLLSAAVAISVPFDLHKSVQTITTGFSKIYEKYILNCLCKKTRRKLQSQINTRQFPKISSLKTLYDFDNQVTAPLHGFNDAMEYYALSSCRQYLSNIQVPTLLLQAKDDPFVTPDSLPQPHELASAIQFELTAKGGHVGFVSGELWKVRYWLEERVPQFLSQYL
ncbi:MAG TPA: hydrolase [Gammaproteobacteria bacterium]|nr:hydrolase [Gammaproteobacteria bacterium]